MELEEEREDSSLGALQREHNPFQQLGVGQLACKMEREPSSLVLTSPFTALC